MWRRLSMLIMALTVMTLCSPEVCCSRDGFNMYKDLLLRGKFDDMEETAEPIGTEDISSSPKLHFYRIPSFVQRKDGSGYVLSRDNFDESMQTADMEPGSEGNSESRMNTRTSEDITGLNKRGPGSILTWALSSKRPLTQHSGSGGPTAFIATMGKREHSLQ